MIKDYTTDHNLSMAELAAKGIIRPPTLSHIKHQKRNLTSDMGARLAAAMEMPAEQFFMELTHLALALQEEDLTEKNEEFFAGENYVEGISRELMDSLSEGDIYWLIAIEKPIEFSSLILDETLLNCISTGSYIRYVFPLVNHEDLLNDVFGDHEGASDILAEHGSERLDWHFHNWQNRFIRRYPNHEYNIRRFIQCYQSPLKGNVWFAPFVKYILIERHQTEISIPDEAWLDVAYHSSSQGGTIYGGQKRCALPLNPMVVHNLKRWCSNSTHPVSIEQE